MRAHKEYYIDFTEGRVYFVCKKDALKWCRDFFRCDRVYTESKGGMLYIFKTKEIYLPIAVLHEITVIPVEQFEFDFGGSM